MASQEVTIRDTFSVGMFGSGKTDKTAKSDNVSVPGIKMLNALGNIYSQLRQLVALTKESLNIEKIKLTKEQLEQRDKSLTSAETTPPPITGDDGAKGPGILGSLKDMFTKQRGPKFWFAVVAAGLALLSRYSEELVQPLAKLLEFFDKHGLAGGLKIIYKKIETWAISEIEHYVDKIKEEFDKFKSDGKYGKRIDELLTSMGRVFVFLDDTIASIEKWYQGIIPEGVSFEDEYGRMHTRRGTFGEKMDAIVDELQPKIVKLISDVFTSAWLGFRNTLLLATFAGLTGKLAYNSLVKSGFFLAPGSVGKLVGGSPMTWGAGAIPVAMLATYAFIQTFRAFSFALEEGVDDEGNFDFSKFVGAFFGGADEGGLTNAFAQAIKMSGVGAGLGMIIAGTLSMAGLVAAGPLGFIVGGLLGLLIGAALGAVLGYIGGDTISEFIDSIGESVKQTIQSIKDAFVGFFSRLKWGILGLFGIEEATIAEKLKETMAKRMALEDQHGFTEGMEAPSAKKIKGHKGRMIHTREYVNYQAWQQAKQEEASLALMVGEQGYGELTQSMLRDQKDLVKEIDIARTKTTTELMMEKDALILQKAQAAEAHKTEFKPGRAVGGGYAIKQRKFQTNIEAIDIELENRAKVSSTIPDFVKTHIQRKTLFPEVAAVGTSPFIANVGNSSEIVGSMNTENNYVAAAYDWPAHKHSSSILSFDFSAFERGGGKMGYNN